MIYRLLLKPVFFLLTPETAHHFTLWLLELIIKFPGGEWLLRKIFCYNHPDLVRNIFGISFPNPIGLAAGFDKDARHLRSLSALGFGFIEVGTVTPLPQPGNNKPRLFRLTKDEALINRMGFNNQGVDVMASRIKNFRNNCKHPIIIGGNIGKNKITNNDEAAGDYDYCFEKLFDVVDYFVVNVSSPNTAGLRELQEKKPLKNLLQRLQDLNHRHYAPKPILLKISPDLTQNQLDDIIEIIIKTKIAGIVATNTTISREGLTTATARIETMGSGGLSGKPIKEKSTAIISYLKSKSKNHFIIIGSGGIQSAVDAQEKLNAGAELIQIYTGMIYKGPGLMRSVNKKLAGK